MKNRSENHEKLRQSTESSLKKIEWMLSSKPPPDNCCQAGDRDPGYGDLTKLNRDGIILQSIGHDCLKNLASDYLELLETSTAIYEANGDYALGIFSSGWCRMMDCASHRLCPGPGPVEALNSGRWLCHESCWTDCAKPAIARCEPVDIECNGGIRMYAVPIMANDKIVGAINLGYGDPPKDPEKLLQLATAFKLNYHDLMRAAEAYSSRPLFIVELAKKRLHATARLIGSMIETRQGELELQKREAFIKTVMDNLPIGVAVNSVNPTVEFCYMNDNFPKLYRTTREALASPDQFWEVIYEDPEFRQAIRNRVMEDCASGDPNRMQWRDIPFTRKDKGPFYICARNIPLHDQELMISTVWDVTEHKLAEIEKGKIEKQLQQADKLGSLGRMAGGMAHNFNNKLQIILSYAERALQQVDPTRPLFAELEEIRKAATQSAKLIRQLLNFARRQTASPRVIDLNETLNETLNMMRQLIGERIELIHIAGTSLWPVKVDPVQIDQLLTNLCLNARDAIDGHGRITIETAAVVLDQADCTDHPTIPPGEYVMLAISDNGCGMDQESLDHLFEPFFTTKQIGTGTGLGLSSAYGMVKQNHGFINVHSGPGQGTTFKVFIPRYK